MEELKVGDIIKERYELVRFLGSGSFGEVWLARDRMTGRDVALKIYLSLDPAGVDEFQREYSNTIDLSSPYLLTPEYFDVFHRRPFLVMKYCERGSSSKLAGSISEEQLWSFIEDVANGLDVLHGQSDPIVHQDIKPDNILIDNNGRFLITDFGISKRLRATMRRQSKRDVSSGAMPYMAPERFDSNPKLSTASDIWSLGASIYELATGELPFSGFGGAMLRNGAEMPKLGKRFSKSLNAFMQACLSPEISNRPKASELKKGVTNKTIPDSLRPNTHRESNQGWDNKTIREKESVDSNNKRHYPWMWFIAIIIIAGISGYLWYSQNQIKSSANEASVASNLDTISTPTESKIVDEPIPVENPIEEVQPNNIVPTPAKAISQSNLPFNPAGCPYLYIKGSDRTAMANRKSKTVHLYNRDYEFTLGDGRPNGTIALISSNGYGQSLFFDLDFSNDENDAFFDEFDDLRPECNMQITAMDFDGDGEVEILFTIQSEDYITTNTYVYKLLPTPYRDSIVKYLGVANGQLHMYVDGRSIIAPYGSQGLYNEYMLASNGKIINIE